MRSSVFMYGCSTYYLVDLQPFLFWCYEIVTKTRECWSKVNDCKTETCQPPVEWETLSKFSVWSSPSLFVNQFPFIMRMLDHYGTSRLYYGMVNQLRAYPNSVN